MSIAVPKFASFKPRKVPAETQIPCTSPTEQGRSSRSPSDGQVSHSKSTSRLNDRDLHATSRTVRHDGTCALTRPLSTNSADDFVIDRKGDPANLRYESTDRYRIPRHHASGRGQIVGLDRRFKIDRDASSSLGLVLTTSSPNDTRPRENTFKKIHKYHERTLRLIKSKVEDDDLPLNCDYVALGAKRRRVSVPREANDAPPDYRSTQGKAVVAADSDIESVIDSDVGDTAELAERVARLLNTQLFRRTRDVPASLDAWTQLIDHQKEMIKPGSGSHVLSAIEAKTLADLRLSLYDKAIPLVSDLDRETLAIARVQEGGRVWSADKTMDEWRAMLQQYPTNHRLCIKYIDTVQSQHRHFRYSDVLRQMLECLDQLKQSASHSSRPSAIAMVQIHVVLRLTRFMQQSGYTELAIAIWQSVMQIFIIQRHHFSDFATRPANLTQYGENWDMEEQRFGDRDDSLEQQLRDNRASACPPTAPFASVAECELSAAEIREFPGKSTQEDDSSDDPFRIILYTDIKPVIDNLNVDCDVDALLDAWLCFHSIVSLNHGCTYSWRADPCLREASPYFGRTLRDLSTAYGRSYVATFESLLVDNVFVDGTAARGLSKSRADHLNNALDTLTHLRPNDSSLAELYLAFQTWHFHKLAPKTVKRMIKARPSSLALYNAAAMIESRLDRPAKAVMIWQTSLGMASDSSQQSDKVLLIWSWAWYEIKREASGEALRILSMAGSDNFGPSDARSGVGPAARLRAHRFFEEEFDGALSVQNASRAALCTSACALLAYLADNHSLAAANELFDKYAGVCSQRSGTPLQLRSRVMETIEQYRVAVIEHHMVRNHPYQIRQVTSTTERALRESPNNSLILSAYARLRQKSSYDPREGIRSSLNSIIDLTEDSSLSHWEFGINQALARYVRLAESGGGPSTFGVRRLFTRALLGPDGLGGPYAHVPILWGKWFSFEHAILTRKVELGVPADAVPSAARPVATRTKDEIKNRDPGKDGGQRHSSALRKDLHKAFEQIKQVVLNGIRLVPWYKEWVLHGLTVLDRADDYGLDRGQLQRMYNVLVEREMRIRIEMPA